MVRVSRAIWLTRNICLPSGELNGSQRITACIVQIYVDYDGGLDTNIQMCSLELNSTNGGIQNNPSLLYAYILSVTLVFLNISARKVFYDNICQLQNNRKLLF